jgi:hypothetical protein
VLLRLEGEKTSRCCRGAEEEKKDVTILPVLAYTSNFVVLN